MTSKSIVCGRDTTWDLYRRSFTTRAMRYLLMMEDLFPNLKYGVLILHGSDYVDPTNAFKVINSFHAHSLCQDTNFKMEVEENYDGLWVIFKQQ